jgi:hypothetical protein
MTSDIKQTIRDIGRLTERRSDMDDFKAMATVPLIDMMRPWLVITNLDFKDVVHVSVEEIWSALCRVHDKLGGILDVLEEDQMRETACRMIASVTVRDADPVVDGDILLHCGTTISWDGGSWQYVSDPKLRMRASAKTYAEALEAVRGRSE